MRSRVKKITLIFCIVLIVGAFTFFKYLNSNKIERVLKSESYNYLPLEAKKYIEDVYNKTGKILLTEKNKKENTPYLNPTFIAYLTLTEEEKNNESVIPSLEVVDFISNDTQITDELPTKFDARDYNGKNYISEMKNQYSTGLCWAFASLEQIESYLMFTQNKPYDETSEIFSIRQMDYATSLNGIKNYTNENGYRDLTNGGNYYMSSLAMSNGITIVSDEKMPFNLSTEKKELYEVLNYGNSLYEVNETIDVPIINSSSTDKDKENYIKTIKSYILKYGSAYVATGSPQGSCGTYNNDENNYVIRNDSCATNTNYGAHAMQIIGWDDEYKYSFCSNGSNHMPYSDSCSGNYSLVNGTGAWLLRNSWGTDDSTKNFQYVYLTFDSQNIGVNFATKISKMSERNWDNNYHSNLWKTTGSDSLLSVESTYLKKINTDEKIEKIKFYTIGQNGKYTLNIKSDNLDYTYNKEITTDLPGIYTIDLSNENIILTDEKFTISIKSTNNVYLLKDSISVFTSNIDKMPIIKTKSVDVSEIVKMSDGNYKYFIYSETKNIPSNEIISYKLFKNETDYSSYIVKLENNIVAENNINASMILNKDIPVGNYTLKISYDNYSFDIMLTVPEIKTLLGSGTESDPYQIYTEEDLNQMHYLLDKYFVIKNDITLTKNWEPIGSKNNPFKGAIDGENHTIYNLNIDSDSSLAVGFIGYYNPKFNFNYYDENVNYKSYREKSYVKNINFSNANIINNGPSGILIGMLLYDSSYVKESGEFKSMMNIEASKFTIDNVYFKGGSVKSKTSDAGVIAANVDIVPMSYETPYLNINKVFSSAEIIGYNSGGLIGYVNDGYVSGTRIMLQIAMTNIQNSGIINVKENEFEYNENKGFSPVIGYINNNANLSIENFIINSSFNDPKYFSNYKEYNRLYGLIGYTTNRYIQIKNGYYLTEQYSSDDYYIKQISTTADKILDKTLYTEWTDFDDNWELNTIDGIPRIPVLKGSDFEYTSIDDINIKLYDEYYVFNNIDKAQIKNNSTIEITENDNIINLDWIDTDKDYYLDEYKITAINKGTAKIHFKSNYDGFEKDILVNVTADKEDNPVITYYSNYNNESYSETLNKLTSFNIKDAIFTRKGFTFKEWNTLANGQGISYKAGEKINDGIDENLRLYAQWEAIHYALKYDGNGGIGQMTGFDDVTFGYSHAIAISYNKFTRENYKFIGWNTKADGTGKSYSADGILNVEDFVDYSENNVLTLYAQWAKTTAKITYCLDKNCTNKDEIEYEIGQSVKIQDCTIEMVGYDFTSWNTKIDGTGQTYNVGDEIILESNLILYPIFRESFTYSIKDYFVDENSKVISKIIVGTTEDDFRNHINLGINYSVIVDTKNSLLYTGGKTKIYNSNELVKEYTNIVIGDINGDGIINSADLLKIRQHLIGVKPLEGIYFTSSDINYDSIVNSADLLRIRQHLIGTKLIG